MSVEGRTPLASSRRTEMSDDTSLASLIASPEAATTPSQIASSNTSREINIAVFAGVFVAAAVLSLTWIISGAGSLLSNVMGQPTIELLEIGLGVASLTFLIVAGYYFFFVLDTADGSLGSRTRY